MRAAVTTEPPPPRSLLPPGSRRLHYGYWTLIFVLTVTVGFGPLFVFIDEVKGRHGQLLSVVAFFVLPVWLVAAIHARADGQGAGPDVTCPACGPASQARIGNEGEDPHDTLDNLHDQSRMEPERGALEATERGYGPGGVPYNFETGQMLCERLDDPCQSPVWYRSNVSPRATDGSSP